MRRRIDLVLLPMMPLLACSLSPAFGQDAPGRSTLRFVQPPAPSVDVATWQDSSTAWPESLEQSPVAASRQPATLEPIPSARPIPRPSVRAAFPSQRTASYASATQVRPAVGYSSGGSGSGVSQASYNGPPRMEVVPSPQPVRRPTKPFSNLVLDSTISPYLNLDHDEDAVELPNYYTFVRPQLEQQEANRRQQMEIQQLSRQWNNGAAPSAGPAHQGPAGRTARFMDTAQFYSRWTR